MRSLRLLETNIHVDLFFEPFNSLIGIVLLSLFVAFLSRGELKRSFTLLFTGSLSHLLLDSLSHSGPRLLIPLSWTSFEVGLLWPDNPVPAILVVVSVLVTRFSRVKRF